MQGDQRGAGVILSSSLRAKRSNPELSRQKLNCFVAIAPRNDDYATRSPVSAGVRCLRTPCRSAARTAARTPAS
ncbi:hypothetical protein YH63_013365 [Afipia massiliensis]|uniref:Uncharacterized protein n=1 Tax=Afipia massiliensis TaxID=211460 RepID=A0A4V6BE48_9BRAD|nr:hypothetical protein YH63_013365 [Afipia massiliensis]